MCVSCGCGKPDDNHGDPRNITLSDLNDAAQAAGTTRDRVIQNIMKGIQSETGPGQNEDYDYGQSQSENLDQKSGAQPGQTVATPGAQTGSAWGQSIDRDNYQPPNRTVPSA